MRVRVGAFEILVGFATLLIMTIFITYSIHTKPREMSCEQIASEFQIAMRYGQKNETTIALADLHMDCTTKEIEAIEKKMNKLRNNVEEINRFFREISSTK